MAFSDVRIPLEIQKLAPEKEREKDRAAIVSLHSCHTCGHPATPVDAAGELPPNVQPE